MFFEKKYAGNQLAVFFNAQDLTSDQMQEIARDQFCSTFNRY
jgi:trans-2,3-dihydro-3-hydroxyanthranilate isomerase